MKKDNDKFRPSVKLPESEKKQPEGKKLKVVDPSDSFEVTIRIRRKKSIDEALKEAEETGKIYSREEYEQTFGLDDADVKKVEDFVNAHGLSVIHTSYSRRSMLIKGTAENFANAFGTKLHYYKPKSGKTFRGRAGTIKIPKELDGIIEGVFGLDNRQQSTPKFKVHNARAKKVMGIKPSFYPTELAKLYNFPDADGSGQCIGIIEFGGGHTLKDLKTYFKKLTLPMPVVKSVAVGTGHNNPGTKDDDEVMLDIEVAAAIAPKATIVVYYAPNTSKGFVDAITESIHDNVNKPSVISISWGAAEVSWTKQSMINFNESCKAAVLLGVTICIAAGDEGSDDGVGNKNVHVDFPSSVPFALACGGTKLIVEKDAINDEIVWHESNDSATGGGVSEFFKLPDYQKNAKVPVSVNSSQFKGRGVPDVAAVADPASGYKVYYHKRYHTIGGTSAVAPLMAGLIARINQLKKKPVGFIHPAIYKNPSSFRDITKGNNITTSSKRGYTASKGWDACTGLGVVDGKKLLKAL